ncbi:MAG: NADH-quinone oxidoreductase subunit N [Acidimicrobiales bacterium]|jgi:NADH-quinone oxidoreductase subunit N
MSLSGLFAAASFATPHINYVAILPELILIGGALVLLVSGQLTFSKVPVAFYSVGSAAVGTAALVASLVLWHDVQARGPFTTIADSVAVDGFAIVFLVLVSCIVIVGSAIANDFLIREEMEGPEYHVLALLAASGAMLMAASNDLILIFVALEIMSIPLYVLAGMDLRRRESGEAAMKYFVLGAFSSAIFVYGIALVYGATGSTNLPQIADYLSTNIVTSNGVLLAGLGLLLVGFGFKVSAVPFHMWTPDVYQGAPTPVTGFMTAIAKAGGFAALLRVFFSTFGTLRTDWQPLLWVIAIITLLLGAVLGLVQRDVKRMLAYSSINHAGFILVGLAAANSAGISGSIYYVFVYAFLVLGSFAVITVVGGKGDREHDLDAYRGLGRRQPLLALAFTVLLLGQTGVPFTTGFFAKLYVISAAVKAHSYALGVIAMLSAAVAAAFYLRLVYLMYGVRLPAGTGNDTGSLSLPVTAQEPEPEEADETAPSGVSLGPVHVPAATALAIFVTVAVTIVFGIWPAPIVDFAKAASFLF